MAQAMIVRKGKRALNLALMRLLVGKKSNASHFAWAGPASAAQLCRQIIDTGHRSVLIVTDGALRQLGVAERAAAALLASDIDVHWFDKVMPDPTFDLVREGAEALRVAGSTAVLAVGGGSSIDAAKAIAASRYCSDDPQTWVGFNKAPKEAAAIYVIPTTAGTGSEATMGAVITDSSTHTKHVVAGEAMLPRAVAIDPELMVGMPGAITAATGIDALTHGIEAYIGVWERGTRTETGRLAVQGVFQSLRQAMSTPDDIEARMSMAVAAYYGGVAINQVNVGNVHAIAHQLGGKYGIPHGVANGLVLPHVLRCYGPLVDERLAELSLAAGVSSAPSQAARASAFIDSIVALRAEVGLPETDSRLQAADFDALADAALAEGDAYPSPRLLDKAEVIAILTAIAG